MFFGMDSKEGKKKRKKYEPWQGGVYGGSIEFEYRKVNYRVNRTFGKTKKDDKYKLYDLTNRKDSDRFTEKLGEEIFGLDDVSFCRSIYMPQAFDYSSLKDSDSIRAKLSNLVEDTNDMNNYENAEKKLEKKRKELKADRGNGGLINELRAELQKKIEDKEAAKSCKIQFEIEKNNIIELEKEASKKEGDIEEKSVENAKKEVEKRVIWEQIDKLKKKVSEKKEEIGKIDKKYVADYPTDEEIKQQYDNVILLKKESVKLKEIKEKMADRIGYNISDNQMENEISKIEKLCNENEELHKELEDNKISTEEEAEYKELHKRFANGVPTDEDINTIRKQLIEIDNLKNFQNTIGDSGIANRQLIISMICGILGIVSMALGIFFIITSLIIPGVSLFVVGILVTFVSFVMKKNLNTYKGVKSADSVDERMMEKRKEIDSFFKKYFDAAENVAENAEVIEELQATIRKYKLIGEKKSKCEEISPKMIENDMVLKNLFSQYYPNKEYYNSFIGTLKNDYSEYLNQKREEKGYEGEIERIEKEIYDFVEKYKLPETDYGKLIETLKSDLNQKEQLLKGLEEAENELKKYEQENLEIGVSNDYVMQGSSESSDIENDKKELDELKTKIARKRASIDAYQKEIEKISLIDDEIDDLNERINVNQKMYELIEMTEKYLEKAKENLANNYVLRVEENFKKYSGLILKDRICEREHIGNDLTIKIDQQGVMRDIGDFSVGISDGIAICMRLALVEALFREEKPFLIFDDPFVNLDDIHMQYALEQINEISKEYQVLYFVCHSSRSIGDKVKISL